MWKFTLEKAHKKYHSKDHIGEFTLRIILEGNKHTEENQENYKKKDRKGGGGPNHDGKWFR